MLGELCIIIWEGKVTSDSALQTMFMSDRSMFMKTLESIVILDIGIIDSVSESGRAKVTSSTFVKGRPIVYEDVEVIYPGNNQGCFVSACSGGTCLIFIPKSCMPNSTDQLLRIGATSYNRDGVKVMPIGNGTGNKVRAFIDTIGQFNILSAEYTLTCAEDTISLQTEDGTVNITLDTENQLSITRQTDTCTYIKTIGEDGVQETWLSNEGHTTWETSFSTDGSKHIKQYNTSDEDNPLLAIDITSEGAVTINVAGDANINANSINLNGDDKSFVTYAELNAAMTKLWTAMTTTPIAGNGSTQPAWTGLPNGIDISAAETQTIKTGG